MKSSTALLSQFTCVLDAAIAKALPFTDQRAYGLVEAVESGKGGIAMAGRNGNFASLDDGKHCTYYHRAEKVAVVQTEGNGGYGDGYNFEETISMRLGMFYNRKVNDNLDNYEVSRLTTEAINGMFSNPENYGLLHVRIKVQNITLDSMQALQDEFRSLGNHQATIERGFIAMRYDILIKYKQNCANPPC